MDFIPEIKDAVIHVGLNSKIEDMNELTNLLNLESFYYWGDKFMTSRLNDSELLNYFKGLVIIEKNIGSCGSTTPAARAYWEIENRHLDRDYSLADWAFQYSDNEYIPFGFIRHGEQSAYEYIQWREDLHRRLIQEKIDKEERKERQLERAKQIEKEKRERDKQRRLLYQKMMEKPPEEQVEAILSDDKHIVYFYMPVIHNLLSREDVTKKDLDRLIFKLCQMKHTPFCKKIAKLIHEKIIIIMYGAKRNNTQETLEKLSIIEKEVDAKVEEILKDEPRMLGFCHMFWGTKKKLLKEEYGIDWLTPAECNPDVMYD